MEVIRGGGYLFEHDPDNSAADRARHGIDFTTAQALWRDEGGVSSPTRWPDGSRWVRVAVLGGRLWRPGDRLGAAVS